MDYCVGVVKNWLPPIDEEDKKKFHEIITGTEQTIGSLMIKQYVKMITPHLECISKSREPDCFASGAIFFFGCLFYIMHFPKWGDYLEDILLYNLLYILVDHYIDDVEMNPDIKKESIRQMWVLIQDPLSPIDVVDSVLEMIAKIYHQLITRRPKTKDLILKVFKAEIEGLKIQNNSNCTREQYLDMAIKKGGRSIEVLQGIVENEDEINDQQAFLWGAILQLVDDSVDVISDIENEIHTIATHDLKTKGNLDDLWIEIIKMIDSAERFIIFKILFSIFSVYLPGRYPKNYSEELFGKTNCVNLFEGCDSSTMLVELITNEILCDEILNSDLVKEKITTEEEILLVIKQNLQIS